jgi:hypothetical protein
VTTYPTNYNITYTAVGQTQGASNPFTYAWTFDDGTTANTATTLKQWATEGLHSATVVATDTVTGGSAESTKMISTLNLYFPDLPTAKSGHRSFSIGGRVWVVQGDATTYSIAPGEVSWTTESVAPPATPAYSYNSNHGRCVSLGTDIYCFGATTGNYSSDILKFDTTSKAWTKFTIADANYYLGTITPVLSYGSTRISAIAGDANDASRVDVWDTSGSRVAAANTAVTQYGSMFVGVAVSDGTNIWILDPKGGGNYFNGTSWSSITSTAIDMVGQYAAAAEITTSTEWLLTGGVNQATNPTNKTATYNKNTGYSAGPDMAIARKNHTATTMSDGKIFIAGGASTNVVTSVTAKCEIYDPATGLFTQVADMPVARSNHSAVLVPNGGVMITGGSDGNASLTSVDTYYPSVGWV